MPSRSAPIPGRRAPRPLVARTRRVRTRRGASLAVVVLLAGLALSGCLPTVTPPPPPSGGSTTTTVRPAPVCTFRNSLSVSPLAEHMFYQGLTFTDGTRTATNVKELQQLFDAHGATEMFARIGTLKVTGGLESGWARGLERARLAATLDLPFNPELGLFAAYGDSMTYQQPPDFRDYPEIVLPGPWFTLTIDQMATALRQYGKAAATQILATGVHVNYWDLGNEVDFGVAGVTTRPPTSEPYTAPDTVDPAIGRTSSMELMSMTETDRIAWSNAHLYPYLGKLLAAARDGIRSVDPTARFSTHIAGAGAWSETTWTAFWDAMAAQGYTPDVFGVSVYPSGPPPVDASDPFGPSRAGAAALYAKYHRPTFVAEWGYPSAATTLDAYNRPIAGYPFDTAHQAQIVRDFVADGVQDGWLSGMRPWAPDAAMGAWGPLSAFTVNGTTATAKPAIDASNHCAHG